MRHVASSVVYPYSLSLVSPREEDHVCLCAGTVRRERAIGKPEHSVQVAVLNQNLKHLARLIREQAVVWHDHSCSSTRFQDCHHMLDEVELLVACSDREIVTSGSLIRALCPERWICHH